MKEIDPRDQTGISGNLSGGFFVGFADGRVWMIDDSIPFETLSPFLLVEGAKQADREIVLGPYKLYDGKRP
jgi:hypothetical protein